MQVELDRTAVVVLAAAAALVGAQTAAHLVDFWVYGLRVGLLDADSEASLFGWFAIVAIAAAALAATRLAWTRHSRTWLATGGLLAAVAAADAAHVRERLPHGTVAVALLLVPALALLWMLRTSWDPVRVGVAFVVVGLVVHVAGPPLLHVLGIGPADTLYQLKIAVKEGAERGGWFAIAAGLALRR